MVRNTASTTCASITFSPHAWGWSARRLHKRAGASVLPTRVGMVRTKPRAILSSRCSPHTRGDGPQRRAIRRGRSSVLPTRVGMVRNMSRSSILRMGSPHTRGDGPTEGVPVVALSQFSPHAWGWSVRMGVEVDEWRVLPTRVGMVRASRTIG